MDIIYTHVLIIKKYHDSIKKGGGIKGMYLWTNTMFYPGFEAVSG